MLFASLNICFAPTICIKDIYSSITCIVGGCQNNVTFDSANRVLEERN